MASSSSSFIRTCKYRVFVSFGGQDVRQTFLSHLRKQLNGDGNTMYDDQGMERGAIIGPELMQAISESRISIVVLSKNYASSSWCLNELLEIFKCKEDGQIVMTVFYGVDPSDVRDKTGDFGKAFNETCARKKDDEKRQKWSKALEEVGNIAGEHIQEWDNESNKIEKISRDVSNKLNATISWDFKDMVGIEAHLHKMESFLHLDYDDGAMIVGICGPAGIGKTTIARALHSRFSCSFRLTCFMGNLREIYNRCGLNDEHGSKLCLQAELLSKILNQDGMRVNSKDAIRERLCDQKVLIILDDVDDLKQLQALADETDWFGPGSRIIVTTEDQALLKKHEIKNTYHVKFPTEEEARKIFCRYAFRKSSKPDGFEKLIKRVTELCSNLPLGLRVMGSCLCEETKDDWEDILQRLENSLAPVDKDLERVLRVGYDRLHEEDQLLFLLIAVFFNYKDDGHVKDMLDKNNMSVKLGLKNLENKSLIQKSIEGNIVMHKLLQKVGRKAIQEQKPSQSQILIDTKDILKFLESESDFTSVIGISLDISTIPNGLHMNARTSKNIRNLQFLSIYKSRLDTNVRVHVPDEMDFPHCLRLLHWDEYPGKRLPRTFTPKFLVELNLRHTNLEKLWEGNQSLPHLKRMDLFQSVNLKKLPDFSNVKNLEMLKLNYCKSLVELPASIANLDKLEQLEMFHCEKLQVVPNRFNLASFRRVNMTGCRKLRMIPDFSGNITELDIADTMLKEVPDSIRFSGLKKFSICGGLVGCIDYGIKDIEKLPDWIKDLHQLQELYIIECRKLASLPELPASLIKLRVNNCRSLKTLSLPKSLMMELDLPNCFKLGRKARRAIIQKSYHAFLACFPGRTIPAMFNHRASGNSLTIRSDCKVFKICVVVSPYWLMDECTLLCDIHINGCPIALRHTSHDVSVIRMEHLCISTIMFSDKDEGWRGQDNEILFKFSTTSPFADIKQCGVLTLDEIMMIKLFSVEQLSEDSDESLSDGSFESCSEQLSEDNDESLSDGSFEASSEQLSEDGMKVSLIEELSEDDYESLSDVSNESSV